MQCSHCHFDNSPGFAFCGQCGAPLAPICPRCGAPAMPGQAFCGACGSPLTTRSEALTLADIDQLRLYLPLPLVEALRLDRLSPALRLLNDCLTHLMQLLTVTQSHLPAYLVEQVMRDPTPGRVGGQFVHGTLLFADISGFTAMSERLSRVGREGAEEITGIVNRYFGLMLNILREHAGQLIKFGGDALLGLFLDPDSVTRAAQAAHVMQLAMGTFTQTQTSQGTFPLRMKVALHHGRFFAVQLGTAHGMEQTLLGAEVSATAALESAAEAGHILLDRAMLPAISVRHQARPLAADSPYALLDSIESASPAQLADHPLLTISREPTLDNLKRATELLEALTPYLPAGLLSRIASAPHALSLEGEHRLVSVLFANVQGLGELVERSGPGHEADIVAALNQYFVAMDQATQRYGGVINKMDLYDHGDKLLAFFGAPLAHEDDAERAVRAALAMQAALSPLQSFIPDLSQRIGISYGYVFAGYVGNAWRHEYTVMGDEVNLAARLMTATPVGQIMVSGNVERKVRALFELEARGEVTVKGKAMPIPILAVRGLRAVPEPVRGLRGMRSPLVGREPEWRQVLAAVENLRTGRGQIVSILGEAGLGKSRLVAELRQSLQPLVHRDPLSYSRTAEAAAPGHLNWYEAHCLSYTESVSYLPFQDLVRQWLGIQASDTEEEAWSKLREAVRSYCAPEEQVSTVAFLANFLTLRLDEAYQARLRYLDAEALQRRTLVAVSSLLEAHTRAAPVVVVLEDIHWMDQASLAMLHHLLYSVTCAPIMFLLLYRSDREKGCWQIHERAAREFAYCNTEMALRPLTPADSQQLLTHLLQSAPPGLDTLLKRAEGNPLYLEEIIRALMDTQVLTRAGEGGWQVRGDLKAVQIPDTLQGVMMARLDRLTETCRWLTQVAAVIGREFTFDVLAYLAAERREPMQPCLAQVQQHEIVHESQRLPQLAYMFKHDLMRDVCYESLLARTRRAYHCKIAEYLETAQHIGQRERSYALIAHHAFLGQDWPRAWHAHLLAAQQAQRLYANRDAIEHFELALKCAAELPPSDTRDQRLRVQAALGELLTTTGQYDQALSHLSAAHELAHERDDRDALAHVCRWLGRLYELRGDYAQAFDWLNRGLDTLGGRETGEAAQLWLIAGLIHSRQGRYEQARTHGENALRIAQQAGQVTVQARAYNLLGLILLRGEPLHAAENFERAFTLYQQAEDFQGQATTHNQLAVAHVQLGHWPTAEQHYSQARAMFEQLGDVYHRAIADINLGEVFLKQGALADAQASYQAALQALQQIGGSLYLQGVVNNNLGATLIRLGDPAAARRYLGAAGEYFAQAQARDAFVPELHRHLAEAALLANEIDEAEAQAAHAVSLARELAARNEEGCGLRVLGEVAAAQGQTARASAWLAESIAILQVVGDEYERARSELALAQVYLLQGEVEEGRVWLNKCVPVFERLAARLEIEAARKLAQHVQT